VKLSSRARFSTVCLHAGQEPDPSTGAIITPIYQTSTYVQEALGTHKGFEYGRTQNPTRMALEGNLAAIEGGKAAFAFASGMAAIGAIATLLKAGDHVVVSDNTYGGTFRLFDKVLTRYQLSFSYVDTSRLDEVERAITPSTRMLFVETPTNPVMRITDLRAAADLAHRHDVRLVVDNTFASPAIQRPIDFGADLVTHSTTKYLNGHSDSVGGIVIGVRDDDIAWLKFVQNAEGAILGPFDSWLVLRGLKTLAVRMRQSGAGGVPERASQGAPRPLSGPAIASPARAGETTDARLRRHAGVRIGIARGGARAAQRRPPARARRESRRRRDLDFASSDDDPRVGPRRPAGSHRHHRRPRPHLGRHRGHRRLEGRPRPGAGQGVATRHLD
jgi:hypothetical protein